MEIDEVLRKLNKYNKQETSYFTNLFSLRLYSQAKEVIRDKESFTLRTYNDEVFVVRYTDKLLDRLEFYGIPFKVTIQYEPALHGYLISADLSIDQFTILIETDGRVMIDLTMLISDVEAVNRFWKQLVYDLFYKRGIFIQKM